MATPGHTTSISLTREQVAAQFTRMQHTTASDPAWHFELALPKGIQRGNQATITPKADGQLVSLGFFHLPQPAADIEIYGLHLDLELDPADFLDLWLERTNINVVSRKRLGGLGGAIGDVVVTWSNGAFAGRCFCLKFGARLLLIWCRCAAADFETVAETFFLAISTFRMMAEPPSPLCQGVRWTEGGAPVPWKFALPANWVLHPEPGQTLVISGQATWTQEGASAVLGKLTFAVVAKELVKGMDNAMARAEQASKDAGLTLGFATTGPEQPPAGFTSAGYRITPAMLNQQNVEVRFRVLEHPKLWMIAGMILPPRQNSPAIWMHAKRVLDIATSTMEVE